MQSKTVVWNTFVLQNENQTKHALEAVLIYFSALINIFFLFPKQTAASANSSQFLRAIA